MKRSTIFLLLLGALCAGATIIGLLSANRNSTRPSEPVQKQPQKRAVKFQKQIAAVGRPIIHAASGG